MKNILALLFIALITSSCTDSSVENEQSATNSPLHTSYLILSIKNTNGDKLLTNGTFAREDVLVEYKRNNEFIPMEFNYCNPDKSDLFLSDPMNTMVGLINYRLTLPNQQVFYIDIEADINPDTPNTLYHNYVKKLYINNELVYEGNGDVLNNSCSGFLMFDLIINE